jgi:hypothetical protein
MSDGNKSVATADSLVALLSGKWKHSTDLAVGITNQPIKYPNDDDEYVLAFDDKDGPALVVSTSYRGLYSARSSPSVYKYLLTSMVSIGAILAGHGIELLSFHDEVRGCLFDNPTDNPQESRLATEVGYLCERDRKVLKRRLSDQEFRDITEVLPLNWLR